MSVGFRHVDHRYPFLWETAAQPPGRWHANGEGPCQYLANTPDGAWAEFLRHEEITDPADLPGIARSLWAIEVPDEALAGAHHPALDTTAAPDMTGDPSPTRPAGITPEPNALAASPTCSAVRRPAARSSRGRSRTTGCRRRDARRRNMGALRDQTGPSRLAGRRSRRTDARVLALTRHYG